MQMQPGPLSPDVDIDPESKSSDVKPPGHALSADRQARDADFATSTSEFGAGVWRAPGSVLSTIGEVFQAIGGLLVWSGAKLGAHDAPAQLAPAPPRSNVRLGGVAQLEIRTQVDDSGSESKPSFTPPPHHRNPATPNTSDPVDAKPDVKFSLVHDLARERENCPEPESRKSNSDLQLLDSSPGVPSRNSTPAVPPPEPSPDTQPHDPNLEPMEVDESADGKEAAHAPPNETPAPVVARSSSPAPPRDATLFDSDDYLHNPALSLQEKIELQKARMYRKLFGPGRRAEPERTAPPSSSVKAKRSLNEVRKLRCTCLMC